MGASSIPLLAFVSGLVALCSVDLPRDKPPLPASSRCPAFGLTDLLKHVPFATPYHDRLSDS